MTNSYVSPSYQRKLDKQKKLDDAYQQRRKVEDARRGGVSGSGHSSYAGADVRNSTPSLREIQSMRDLTEPRRLAALEQSKREAADEKRRVDAELAEKAKLKIENDERAIAANDAKLAAEVERRKVKEQEQADKFQRNYEADASVDLLQGYSVEQTKQILGIAKSMGLGGTSLGTQLAIDHYRSLPYVERMTNIKQDLIDGQVRE